MILKSELDNLNLQEVEPKGNSVKPALTLMGDKSRRWQNL